MNTERIPELLGSLSEFLPDYNQRAGQQEMAQAVARAIADRQNLVVEGGTGVGKSMAYLVPALLAAVEDGARILVATSHKPLQDQLAKKDLPLLAKLFKAKGFRSFESVTLKGISNYLCWNSADNEAAQLVMNQQADKAVRHALTADQDFSGDWEDFPFNVGPETRQVLSANSEDCLGMRCPHRDRCFALRARKKAETANVVVTNHALLTLDIKSEGALIPGDFATYIIDEGHNFEENATRANGLQLTLGAVRRFLNNEFVKKAVATNMTRHINARDDLEKFQGEIVSLFTLRDAQGQDSDDDANRVTLKRELSTGRQLAESLKEILGVLKSYTPRTEEEVARVQRVYKQGVSVVERLEKISANGDPNLVYYAERNIIGAANTNERQPVLKSYGRVVPTPTQTVAQYSVYAMPVDISGYLKKWFNENNVIVTSATLSDGQNFHFFTTRVGLFNPATLIVQSPFNYKERVRLFFPRLQPAAPGTGYTANLTRQLVDLLNLAPGRVLLLFTSHAMLEGVWKSLNGQHKALLNPARPLFKQGEAQMNRIIADFQKTEHGVILGTRSWWQGVDLPGMRMLILDKLPFPQLNDPILRARTEQIDKAGGSSFNELMLPTAIITFRQGFGRLMRQESDWGVVVVCDERIVQKSYGRRFLKSLPELTILGNIEQLRQFYAQFGN
jgi:ATP-dependent DNA helicase DinG